MQSNQIQNKKAVLVGVEFPENKDFALDMEELVGLCQALSIECCTSISQSLAREDSATFIGSGKVEEVRAAVLFHEVDLVIFQNALSPSQLHNLSKALSV